MDSVRFLGNLARRLIKPTAVELPVVFCVYSATVAAAGWSALRTAYCVKTGVVRWRTRLLLLRRASCVVRQSGCRLCVVLLRGGGGCLSPNGGTTARAPTSADGHSARASRPARHGPWAQTENKTNHPGTRAGASCAPLPPVMWCNMLYILRAWVRKAQGGRE
jgi:hypothetical protein